MGIPSPSRATAGTGSRIGSKSEFGLILMVAQMPEMDGIRSRRAIREDEKGTNRRVPIIALSAHSMDGDRERCLAAGFDGCVPKPIRSERLLARIAELI
jgi:two-component system, sensor histidine kinase and response regulator